MRHLSHRRSWLLSGGAATALAAGLVATQPAAQEGGRVMSFDVSQRLEAESNPDAEPDGGDASLVSTTELGFGMTTSTPTTSLGLNLDARLRQAFDDSEGPTLEGPDATIDYSTRAANASFEASLAYSERDISYIDRFNPDGDDAIDGFPDDRSDLEGEGTRQSLRFSARAEYGLRDPFGLALTVQARDLSYEDVTSEELEDSRAYSTELETRFDLRPTLQVTSSLGYQHVTEGGVEEETVGIGAGVSLLRPNVTYSFGGLVDIVEGEPRVGLTAGFGGALPRGGTYEASLGVTRTIDDNLVLTADGSYTAPLTPLSQLELQVERSVSDDIDEGEQVTTALDAIYTREMTPLTQLSLEAGLLRESDSSGDNASTDARLATSVTRQLTRDWGLSAGVSHEYSDDEAGSASSNAIFVQIGRSFVTRF